MSPLSLIAFEFLFLSLTFNILTITFLDVDGAPCFYPTKSSLLFFGCLNQCLYQILEAFIHYLFEYFPCPFLSFLYFWYFHCVYIYCCPALFKDLIFVVVIFIPLSVLLIAGCLLNLSSSLLILFLPAQIYC